MHINQGDYRRCFMPGELGLTDKMAMAKSGHRGCLTAASTCKMQKCGVEDRSLWHRSCILCKCTWHTNWCSPELPNEAARTCIEIKTGLAPQTRGTDFSGLLLSDQLILVLLDGCVRSIQLDLHPGTSQSAGRRLQSPSGKQGSHMLLRLPAKTRAVLLFSCCMESAHEEPEASA